MSALGHSLLTYWQMPWPPLVVAAVAGFIVLNAIIGAVTYVTLLERKFAARMQSRIGPYRVGPHGLLQPIADALKLMMKEDIIPTAADRRVFNLAPVVFLVPCMLIFATIAGIVVILDSRVKTKRYGKLFIDSLPTCRQPQVE